MAFQRNMYGIHYTMVFVYENMYGQRICDFDMCKMFKEVKLNIVFILQKSFVLFAASKSGWCFQYPHQYHKFPFPPSWLYIGFVLFEMVISKFTR